MRGAVVVEAFFIVGCNCKVTYKSMFDANSRSRERVNLDLIILPIIPISGYPISYDMILA
jgi:hypothetical protein